MKTTRRTYLFTAVMKNECKRGKKFQCLLDSGYKRRKIFETMSQVFDFSQTCVKPRKRHRIVIEFNLGTQTRFRVDKFLV
jgi:hypothetical protein